MTDLYKTKGAAEATPMSQTNGTTRLLKLQDKVETILEVSPKSRADDNFLAYRLYREYYPHVSLTDCLVNREALKIPSVESIGRCRRKIQQSRIELRADKAKEDIKINAQADFIEYAGM